MKKKKQLKRKCHFFLKFLQVVTAGQKVLKQRTSIALKRVMETSRLKKEALRIIIEILIEREKELGKKVNFLEEDVLRMVRLAENRPINLLRKNN